MIYCIAPFFLFVIGLLSLFFTWVWEEFGSGVYVRGLLWVRLVRRFFIRLGVQEQDQGSGIIVVRVWCLGARSGFIVAGLDQRWGLMSSGSALFGCAQCCVLVLSFLTSWFVSESGFVVFLSIVVGFGFGV